MYYGTGLRPGCQAKAISMCFSLQQPLPEVFTPWYGVDATLACHHVDFSHISCGISSFYSLSKYHICIGMSAAASVTELSESEIIESHLIGDRFECLSRIIRIDQR